MIEAVYLLNTIILSMATKQQLFDSLESEIFQAPNIYSDYINTLIVVNIRFMGFKKEKVALNKYKLLIEKYLSGEITEPNDLINILMDDKVMHISLYSKEQCNICNRQCTECPNK